MSLKCQARLEKQKQDFLKNNPNSTWTMQDNIITIENGAMILEVIPKHNYPLSLPSIKLVSGGPPKNYRRKEGEVWFEVLNEGEVFSSWLNNWRPQITIEKIVEHINQEFLI